MNHTENIFGSANNNYSYALSYGVNGGDTSFISGNTNLIVGGGYQGNHSCVINSASSYPYYGVYNGLDVQCMNRGIVKSANAMTIYSSHNGNNGETGSAYCYSNCNLNYCCCNNFDGVCANEGLYVAFLRTDSNFYTDTTTPYPADHPPHHVVPTEVKPATAMDDDELFLAASYHPKRQELLTHLVVDVLGERENEATTAGGGADGWKATQSIADSLKKTNISPAELHAMVLWLAIRRGMQTTDKAVMIVGLRKHQQEQVEKAFGDKTALHRAVLFVSAPNDGLVAPNSLPVPPTSCQWVIMFAGAPSSWFKEILSFRKDVSIDHYRHIEEIIKAIREMLQSDKYAVKQSSTMIDKLLEMK